MSSKPLSEEKDEAVTTNSLLRSSTCDYKWYCIVNGGNCIEYSAINQYKINQCFQSSECFKTNILIYGSCHRLTMGYTVTISFEKNLDTWACNCFQTDPYNFDKKRQRLRVKYCERGEIINGRLFGRYTIHPESYYKINVRIGTSSPAKKNNDNIDSSQNIKIRGVASLDGSGKWYCIVDDSNCFEYLAENRYELMNWFGKIDLDDTSLNKVDITLYGMSYHSVTILFSFDNKSGSFECIQIDNDSKLSKEKQRLKVRCTKNSNEVIDGKLYGKYNIHDESYYFLTFRDTKCDISYFWLTCQDLARKSRPYNPILHRFELQDIRRITGKDDDDNGCNGKYVSEFVDPGIHVSKVLGEIKGFHWHYDGCQDESSLEMFANIKNIYGVDCKDVAKEYCRVLNKEKWKCFECGEINNSIINDVYCNNNKCKLGINPYYWFIYNQRDPRRFIALYPILTKQFGISLGSRYQVYKNLKDFTNRDKSDNGNNRYENDKFCVLLKRWQSHKAIRFICGDGTCTDNDVEIIQFEHGMYQLFENGSKYLDIAPSILNNMIAGGNGNDSGKSIGRFMDKLKWCKDDKTGDKLVTEVVKNGFEKNLARIGKNDILQKLFFDEKHKSMGLTLPINVLLALRLYTIEEIATSLTENDSKWKNLNDCIEVGIMMLSAFSTHQGGQSRNLLSRRWTEFNVNPVLASRQGGFRWSDISWIFK